ncbi:MAG: hypothetical protein A2Y95_13005 [Deltaproteobacteria bacterium RBG_13_65_10]|nr:MAG: hypothetical protein A2Y95_13005 [Deltaproteobacteria bacterium RBG_13_65_10]
MPLSLLLALAGGAVLGALVTWLILRGRADVQLASLRTQRDLLSGRVEESQESLQEAQAALRRAEADRAALDASLRGERENFEAAQARSRETFESLAAQALRDSTQSFLDLAKQHFESISTGATGELENRKQAIESLVKPIGETLHRYQEEIKTMEARRNEEQGELRERIRSLAELGQRLEKETGNLASALRAPQVRGRWGEYTLRRAAELSGMVAHCDFYEQASVDTEDGRLRPDMIVQLPARRQVVIDAKVVLNAYIDAVNAPTQEARDGLLEAHARNVRTRVKELSSKAYWSQFEQAPDYCVLFLPSEGVFSAAMEHDPDLFEYAIAMKVILASPGTLIALLHAVGYGWRQEQLAESADRISQAGSELYDRVVTWMEHLGRMRDTLGKAVDHFNRGAASLQSRVIPSARRIKDLGSGTSRDIPAIEPIESSPAPIAIPEPLSANEEEEN